MEKILLVSHGSIAKGMYEAASMIVGETLNVDYVCLSKDKGIEEFKEELNTKKDWMEKSDNLVILADLLGGSPYTTTIAFLQNNNMLEKASVIAGMNLSLLLCLLIEPGCNNVEKVERVMEEAKNGISLFEVTDDDDFL